MKTNETFAYSVVGVIPARLASTRLPQKMLKEINGVPLVVLTAQNALKSGVFNEVIIATDAQEILDASKKAGFKAYLTDEALPSGTCRVGEIAKITNADVYINIQGDEPLVCGDSLRELAQSFKNPNVKMATLSFPLKKEDENNPNVVKVVTDINNNALYFSRSLIPYPREEGLVIPMKHLGVYGYRRETLLKFLSLPDSTLEKAESLEQLRALYHGIKIHVIKSKNDSVGVDTLEDFEKVKTILESSELFEENNA